MLAEGKDSGRDARIRYRQAHRRSIFQPASDCLMQFGFGRGQKGHFMFS